MAAFRLPIGSEFLDSASRDSVCYDLPCVDPATGDDTQLPQDDTALDSADQFDNSYTLMGLDSSDSWWQFIETDANTSVFPLDSESLPAHENSFDATLTNEHDGLNAGDIDYAGLVDYAFLQPSADQPGQQDPLSYDSPQSSIRPSLLGEVGTRENTPSPSTAVHSAGRGLPRRRSRYRIQEIDRRTAATFIPPVSGPADPLERWKNSPPEAEAASLSAIQNALENAPTDSGISRGPALGPHLDDLFQTPRHAASRAASTVSGESATSASSYRSNRSRVSVRYHGSQSGSDRPTAGIQKKQVSTGRKKRSSANNSRIFCCTFCCDKFKSKYDWVRHEKSLHLDLENWSCAPFGGSVILPSTGRTHCAYCNQLDPSPTHLEQHNHGVCQQQTRTFRRKDHLFQHLRLVHRLETMPLTDGWKNVATNFSAVPWPSRKGDHEFPPEIAAQVKHSVPPYLLDFESRTFVPFTATNGAVNDHLSQMLSRASFRNVLGEPEMPPDSEAPRLELPPAPEPQLDCYTEVLTRHLSHYARGMMSSGVVPTDQMFQSEARRMMFGSEDQWDQTLADVPE
ncbi:C2H2-type zinc finger protein [Aspergillus brunneoviolaceus CBS 621.78]|uniref:Uncharacterized protein n=1 Tax=Aspergillus brunneoviolaceus CBS 621.78 TaxID=1450534 RepID=A0ACD1GQ87_9EURO|nr:hypothetical protein BO95DRAFT_458181 [Aspergillus brunneoviolaceus CBS 621.78]RAH51426.1 hypothetical protein BO95DRAFT_458181 [Aspergillus brunneoviolaceus CBS 621.78]